MARQRDRHEEESCNPCCCWNLKDGAVTIGIWSLVFSIAQLGLMGWQMAAIKYEKDRAANTLLPNYNTYGRFDVPSYYESYWQSPEERYYTGLFIIQILCLISVFFLLFASCALIYGVHTWSKYLMFPWFICMISAILSSLAYCIMWWCGDVRDYWLALTILEIIGVFINIYCLVAVIIFYRRIEAETDFYEGKNRAVVYRSNRSARSSRRDLLDNQFDTIDSGLGGPYPEHERIERTRNPALYQPAYVAPAPVPTYIVPPGHIRPPQTFQPVIKSFPEPKKFPPLPNDPPYPVSNYEKEPRRPRSASTLWQDDDPIGSWVKDQQEIALLSGGRRVPPDEANSEPAVGTPVARNLGDLFPLQHSRSVPSMYDDESRADRHHRRRGSSRRRHQSGHKSRERERDRGDRDRGHHHHRSRHRSTSLGGRDYNSYYSSDSDSEFSRRRHGSRRRTSGRGDRRGSEESESDRNTDVRKRSKRDDGRRSRAGDRERRGAKVDETDDFPLNRGLTIPQHIVIPPSAGTRGPDGRLEPQKFQINSEIVIKYDDENSNRNGFSPQSTMTGTTVQRRPLPPTPTTPTMGSRVQSTF